MTLELSLEDKKQVKELPLKDRDITSLSDGAIATRRMVTMLLNRFNFKDQAKLPITDEFAERYPFANALRTLVRSVLEGATEHQARGGDGELSIFVEDPRSNMILEYKDGSGVLSLAVQMKSRHSAYHLFSIVRQDSIEVAACGIGQLPQTSHLTAYKKLEQVASKYTNRI